MRRPLLLLAALALPAAGLTACGNGDGSTTIEAVDLIRSSPTAMADVGSMQMTLTMDVGGEELEGEGAFDLAAGTGSLTMALSAPLGDMETVFEDDAYYMSTELFAGLDAGLDLDEPWIRIDLAELSEMSGSGIDLSNLGSSSSNPTDALGGLEAIAEDGVEELGTEEIRGVEATGYAVEIDMAAALEQLEEQAGEDLVVDEEQAEQFLDAFGDTPMAVEVWLDDDGLTRRYVMEMEIQGQTMTQTMEFFAFGEPVEVDVPDEDETIELTELLSQVPGFDS